MADGYRRVQETVKAFERKVASEIARLVAEHAPSAPPPRASLASAAALSTAPSAALLGADATAAQVAAARSQRACCLTTAHIAPLVAIGDLLSMLGSGMTIKFFALFFWQGLGLEPVAVNAVYVAGPLGIAVSALLAQKLSLCIGRIQTCLLCRGIGIGLLVAIAYVQSAAIVLPLYLLRTWLMNCTAGLTKSVLNDYVAKANRGKWNSLESINLFGVARAALGGWLIDVIGYRHTFLITAALQLCAAVCIAPLAFLVHAESGARGFRRPADMLPATSASTNAEPLLPGPGAVLKWARENGCPWDEGATCAYAAYGGHLDVLKWARLNGCPWDENSRRLATEKWPEVFAWG